MQQSRPSCAWHHLQQHRLVETIRIASWGTNAVQGKFARGPGQLDFRGTLCQLTITGVLPDNSRNKYGAYFSLQGGPFMADFGGGFATDMSDHRRETMAMGCTVLARSPNRNCTIHLTPPQGYALDQRFVNNSLSVEFFTVDPVRIQQLRKKPYELTPNTRTYADLIHTWKRCPPSPVTPTNTLPLPPPPPAKNSYIIDGTDVVNDKVVFGPTEYSFNGQEDVYFVVDYRTYFIKAVTGVDYHVVVGKALENSSLPSSSSSTGKPGKKLKRTPLTVFFAQEPKDFYLGIDCNHDKTDKTGNTCIPPTELKLKQASVCEGFVCKGSIRGLDPKQQYFLWISYPRYLDPSNNDLESAPNKYKIPYATEMVEVHVIAKDWKLGKFSSEPIEHDY
jgi:hypothetical protein